MKGSIFSNPHSLYPIVEEYVKLEAARLHAESIVSVKGNLPEHSVRSYVPTDISLLRILRESNQIYSFVTALIGETRRIYQEDIETRQNTAGRLIDPAMPVRFSGGIKEIASLTDSAENRLSLYNRRIDQLESEASFDTDCEYEELARIAISLDRKMIDRARLYLHSHLWMLWTVESLSQADQIYGLMTQHDRFDEMGESAFAYIAHPPIVVSTLACSAMIEEVGAEYINQFVSGKSVNPENTQASKVLEKISGEFTEEPDFDISAIRETIVTSRNDISHYLSKRPKAVTAENLENHVTQGLASIRLVGLLNDDLVTDVFQDYRHRVLHQIVN